MPKKTIPTKRIGILHSGTSGKHDKEYNKFIQSLKSAGYAQPKNLQITGPLWAKDDLNTLQQHAKTLATTTPRLDLIVAAGGSASAMAATKETNAADPVSPIPVVFTTYFELNRPAANTTGVCARTSELDPTRLYLLNQRFPAQEVGALVNSTRPQYNTQKVELDKEADRLGLELKREDVNRNLGDPATLIKQAFANWRKAGITTAIVTADPIFNDYRQDVVKAAQSNNIKAIYQWHEFVDDGGDLSYGTGLMEAYQLAGTIAGQVLDGADPASIPVQPLSNIGLVINRTTAKLIPKALLAGARLARGK